MLNQKNFPIKMIPQPKETVWGGSKLEAIYKKNKHNLANIAESWELSAISGMESRASDGYFEGKGLSEIYKDLNSDKECPVLIKFIDSESDLSIQVHPHTKNGSELPKNECWYILSAEKDSKIAYGFKPSVTVEDIDRSVTDGSIVDTLNYESVKSGDFFYVPAGLVHAIGKGITLLEIQQSSDTTFRLFDYNRLDKNGEKRELHVEKGKSAIIHFTEEEINDLCFSKTVCDSDCICSCDYFSVFKITSKKDCSSIIQNTNSSVTFLSDGYISKNGICTAAKKGDTFYLPPSDVSDTIIISSGEALLSVF